ncbi:MAG: AsnC family transcriptional regulator [Syntrophales bacterium]|jgi:DNA-binding Lrp family transcriptional regulator|nr:AsnC family transcriptional regulator [Syntrophales bacterium]
MDEIDRRILNIIQDDFPVEPDPYAAIGEKAGIGEDEAYRRIMRMKEEGIIRRIGAVFDREKLGYAGTLCAARVPEDRVNSFVSAVNAYPGITHNYRRNHDYNIWFTLIAPGREEIERIIAEIAAQTGISDILDMPACRTFKIKATFEL